MPVTSNILDPLPAAIAEELRFLRTALDACIPPKHLDHNLLIGTWNIRAFGDLTEKWEAESTDTPKRDLHALICIAEIVSRFDVVALQEVKGNIKALRHMLRYLGPNWGLIMTDVTLGAPGNDERMAFIFDTRRVTPSGLACELVLPEELLGDGTGGYELQRQFARTPYAVSFLCGSHTFILTTLHVLYGEHATERTGELVAIARWLADWAEREDSWNHSLLALGDFNIDRQGDPNYEAFTSTGLRPPKELEDIPRTIFDDGTDKFYDQIAWFGELEAAPLLSLSYNHRAGCFDFRDVVFGSLSNTELSWRISDHFPLWVEFLTPQS